MLPRRGSHIVAVLSDIRSVHNVGSMFRTADGAGLEKLYLCGVTPLPLDRFGKVRSDFAKVSLGAEQWLSWEHCNSTLRLLTRLKKEGYAIFAVEQAPGSVPPWKVSGRLPRKIALVVGNEVDGLSRAVLERAGKILEIPMYGKKESLNVGVAFGVVAYALRQGEAPADHFAAQRAIQ
jgi:23S rRNA (guanosine2251-2'-O)-methyltransferase